MSGTFRVLLVRFFFFNQIVVTQVFSVCEISSRTCEFSLCKLYLSKISTALINISPGKRVLTCSTCQFPCYSVTVADCNQYEGEKSVDRMASWRPVNFFFKCKTFLVFSIAPNGIWHDPQFMTKYHYWLRHIVYLFVSCLSC